MEWAGRWAADARRVEAACGGATGVLKRGSGRWRRKVVGARTTNDGGDGWVTTTHYCPVIMFGGLSGRVCLAGQGTRERVRVLPDARWPSPGGFFAGWWRWHAAAQSAGGDADTCKRVAAAVDFEAVVVLLLGVEAQRMENDARA